MLKHFQIFRWFVWSATGCRMWCFNSESSQASTANTATDAAAITAGADSPVTKAGDFSDVQSGESSRAQDDATLTNVAERGQIGGIQLSPYGSNVTNSPTTINQGFDSDSVRSLLSDALSAGQATVQATASQATQELQVLKDLAGQKSDADAGNPENLKNIAVAAILGLLGLGWLLTRK